MESVVNDLKVKIEMPGYCPSAEDMATNMLVLHLHGPERIKAAYRLRRFLKAYCAGAKAKLKKKPIALIF